MPKVSKETVSSVEDFGVAEDRAEDLEGYTVNFTTIREAQDLAPAFAGLPGKHCSCPHWGYMLKGRMTITYADHQDVLEPGDAFYLPPGHTPAVDAGTEFVMFSPAEELHKTVEVMMKNMEAQAG